MSWWDIDDHGSVMGDEPADLIGAMFAALDQQRGDAPRPAFQSVLDAIASTLLQDRGELLDETGVAGRFERLRARLKDGTVLESRRRPSSGDPLEVALRRCLGSIARVYEGRWERRPRAIEIAHAFAFELRTDTESYVSDLRTGQLLDIEAETSGAEAASGATDPELLEVVRERFADLEERRGQAPRPTLQGLLDIISTVLDEGREQYLDETAGRFEQLRARLRDGATVTGRIIERPDASTALRMHDVIEGLADKYRERHDRWPSPTEVGQALASVLRTLPERHLADVRPGELVDLDVITGAPGPTRAPTPADEGHDPKWMRLSGGRGLRGTDTRDVVFDLFDGIGEPKPSFQQVLDVLATLMGHSLSAVLEGGSTIRSSGRDVTDERLTPLLSDAMQKITKIYEAGQGRPPTAAEMACCFCYVLRVDTDEFFSDDPPVTVADILVE